MMRNRSGFTLIEILVVLGILGITIPAFLTISAYTRNMSIEARLRSGAILLAERASEELIANAQRVQDELETSSPYGSPPHDESPYTWSYMLQHGEGDFAGLTEIIVKVTWQYAGRARSLEVATYAR